MRIVYVGHGLEPIPPQGWGAVEHVIWQYAQRLQAMGHQVDIVNKRRWKAVLAVIRERQRGPIDVVHCHAEKPVLALSRLAKPLGFTLVSTNHVPFDPRGEALYSRKAVRRCAPAPNHFALRADYREAVLALNPGARVSHFPNGVEVMRFAHGMPSNGRAIYVGRVQDRKRQNEVATLLEAAGVDIDFVGPMDKGYEPNEALRKRWIGSWNKEELYANLGKYGCLVLLSRLEGQPLVVVEALAAGLPVVVSPDCAQNLDRDQPFIFVVDDESEVPTAVTSALALPREVRLAARQYAEDVFDYDRLVVRYLRQLEEWRRA